MRPDGSPSYAMRATFLIGAICLLVAMALKWAGLLPEGLGR